MAWKAKKQQQQNRKQNTHGPQLFLAKLPTETLGVLPQKHSACHCYNRDKSAPFCFEETRIELKIILAALDTEILCFASDEITLHACNTV